MKLTENEKALFAAVSDLDDQYIEKADKKRAHAVVRFLKRSAVVAAALALVIFMQVLLPQSGTNPSQPSAPTPTETFKFGLTMEEIFQDGGFFAITAHAAETGEEVYRFNNTYRNFVYSSPTDRQEFEGKDVLFSFFVQYPEDRNRNFELIYAYDDVIVSKNQHKDAHVHCLDVGYEDKYGQSCGKFYFTGWFDKPTDLTISMLDAVNDQVLQKLILHIEFDEEENVYLLTVTEHYIYKEET